MFDTDGNRVTAFLTNSPQFDPAFLDMRHRARGRCENRIKSLKSAGLVKLPFFAFGANQAWANLAMFALNLVTWVQLAVLSAEHAAGSWDLKRWRYRVWSLAGKLVTGSRKPRILINQAAPEAALVLLLHERINVLAGGVRGIWWPESLLAGPWFLQQQYFFGGWWPVRASVGGAVRCVLKRGSPPALGSCRALVGF